MFSTNWMEIAKSKAVESTGRKPRQVQRTRPIRGEIGLADTRFSTKTLGSKSPLDPKGKKPILPEPYEVLSSLGTIDSVSLKESKILKQNYLRVRHAWFTFD